MNSMMRKRLLVFATAVLACAGIAQAQCTPNPFVTSLGIPGVYPNPIQQSSLAAGSVGDAYTETITIIVPGDTTIDLSAFTGGFPVPPVNVAIDYQKTNAVTGLPPGLSFACAPSNCTILGDSAGCIGITGIPTQPGLYTVQLDNVIAFTVPSNIPVIGGQQMEVPVPGLSWDMEVAGAVGITSLSSGNLSFQGIAPNPASGSTSVQFTSAKPLQLSLQVRDLAGRSVMQQDFRAQTGDNSHRIELDQVQAGIYFLSLTDGKEVITQKLVVTN